MLKLHHDRVDEKNIILKQLEDKIKLEDKLLQT